MGKHVADYISPVNQQREQYYFFDDFAIRVKEQGYGPIRKAQQRAFNYVTDECAQSISQRGKHHKSRHVTPEESAKAQEARTSLYRIRQWSRDL